MPNLTGPVRVAERLSGTPEVPQDARELLFSLAEDMVVLKAQITALLGKLDAEAGGGVATFDTNYSTLCSVAAVKTVP